MKPRVMLAISVLACASVASTQASGPGADEPILNDYGTVVLHAPKPDYPFAARAHHAVGSGMFLVRVRQDGAVASVSVVKSTGHRELDQSCIDAFRQWRFRPDFARRFGKAKIPVTFTMEGAHY